MANTSLAPVPYSNGLYAGAPNTNYNGNPTLVPYNNGFYAGDANPNMGPTISGTSAPRPAPPPPDPYAKWGGQAAYNDLVGGFNTQKQGVIDSANAAGDQTASQYNRSIMDFLDSSRLGQQQIDRKGANNELAKMQGVNGVMGMVSRGINSSGVMLNNKNAGDSSATGAIANAYGQIGRGELANVGNQYEQGNMEIQGDQDAFGVQQASGIRSLQGTKEDSVNSIVNDARNQLSAIDAQMQQASLPDRIALDQEREAIKQNLLGKLQAYDQQLTQGVAGIQASTADQRRERAAELARRGTDLGADAFGYTNEAPAMWQGPAPSGGNLPIYTMPRGRREG